MKFIDFKNLLSLEKDYAIIDDYKDDFYITSLTKIKIKHSLCNHEFETCYKYFKKGRRCPNCNKYKPSEISANSIKVDLFNLVGDEYTLLSDNIENKKMLFTLRHNICGKEFSTNYYRFFGKKEHHLACRCPFCSHGHLLKTNEEFKKEIFDLVGDEYKVLSEYKGNKVKVKFLHTKCNHEFEMAPNWFTSAGHRCSYCRGISIGENKIDDFLLKNNINFKKQYRIPECKDKKPLPFDYYIERPDKSWFLVEYQGSQHYITTGKVPFATESLKKHDLIKKEYCDKNNIDLLIISFKDYDKVEEIIKNKIVSSTIPMEDINLQKE